MIEQRFLFNGSAVPFAGEITRIDPIPHVEHVLDDRASSALSVTGGLSTGMGEGFEFRVSDPRSIRLFSAREYGSSTSGKWVGDGGFYQTEVASFVKSAEVIERIQVDHLESRLISVHGLKDRNASIRPQPSTTIQGVRFDGVELLIELDLEPFQKWATKQAYKRGARLRHKLGIIPEAKGVIFDTIVKKMRWNGTPPEGAVIRRNVVVWKDVGRIHFGEILLSDHSRRLTMFRAQLGSPMEGVFAMGDAETNGLTVP
jgi:hypothetical protein